jgi:Ca-activated chloride channel family protein
MPVFPSTRSRSAPTAARSPTPPVPVRPADLQQVAELTGGQAFEAQTGDELTSAYDQIAESLDQTIGEPVEIVNELTWKWALAAFLTLVLAWALSLWWLRGMV